MGLLLLRAAVGVTTAVQGGLFLADRSDRAFGTWAVGLLTVITGALLLIGLLTPIASLLVGLIGAGVALSRFPMTSPGLFDSSLTTILVVTMAAAIGFLGPGAFSIDSHLFGRREIIIPPRRSPKS